MNSSKNVLIFCILYYLINKNLYQINHQSITKLWNKQQSDKLLDDELFNELIREIQSQGSDWYDSFSLPRIRNNLLNVINNKYKITDRAPYLDLSAYNNFEEYVN